MEDQTHHVLFADTFFPRPFRSVLCQFGDSEEQRPVQHICILEPRRDQPGIFGSLEPIETRPVLHSALEFCNVALLVDDGRLDDVEEWVGRLGERILLLQ